MKRNVLIMAAFLCTLVYGALGANATTTTTLYDEDGHAITLQVPEVSDAEIEAEVNSPGYKMNNSKTPDTVKLGDVFEGDYGLERVYAVNDKGEFLTEPVEE